MVDSGHVGEGERWSRVKQLYHAARGVPVEQRDGWLRSACAGDAGVLAEVSDLLAVADESFLDAGAPGALRRLADGADPQVGQRVGAYRLLDVVGEGGMGTVYLAERDEPGFAQRVALKRVRSDGLGAEARASFLRERSVLARLVHPHIAQLHDGGVADDGVPHFTLEYVEGQPITRYCERHRLDLRARLRLVLQVCAAVEYAHRNLVVHRDLKPSNILVTGDGEAKLLHFGIAKLLDTRVEGGDAMTQSRCMTPQYAAPEQVLGDPVSTATDVYAIGVLLYELCCGHLPYPRAETGAASWAKAVVEDVPEPMHKAFERDGDGDAVAAGRRATGTALRRSLRGDLDRIVRRALDKDPDRRHASVAALAQDLRRVLDGRPVAGGGRIHRARLFLRRHWLPLGAAAAIALVLIGSSAAVLWQARERERAAQMTVAVKDFLYGLFTAVDPREAKGRDISARELVDRGAARIEHAAMDPLQRAEIEATLGRLYYQLGVFDRAGSLQEAAARVLVDDPGQALTLARLEAERADTLTDAGDLKASAPLAASAVARMRALRAAAPDLAKALHSQARLDIARRQFAAAKVVALEELSLVRDGGDGDAQYRAYTDAGGAVWGLSEGRAAMSYFGSALDVARRKGAADDIDVAKAQTNLAMAMQQQSRYAEALAADLAALAIVERTLGGAHPLTMSVKRDLGLCYQHLGEYAKARDVLGNLLETQRSKLGADNPAVAGTDINYGILLTDAGDLAGAEAAEREAREIFEKKYGHAFQGVRIAQGNLAAVHMRQGRYEEAARELGEVEAEERALASSEMDMFMTTHRLGELARLRGDATRAIELERRALSTTLAENGEATRFAAMVHRGLGLALRDHGDTAGAVSELRASLRSYASYLPRAEHPLAAEVRIELAALLLDGPAREEGVGLLREAVGLRERFFGREDARTRAARDLLSAAVGGHG